MIVDLPEPVAPSRATTWPGCASNDHVGSTVVLAEVGERDVLEAHVALRPAAGVRRPGASCTSDSASRISKMRSPAAAAMASAGTMMPEAAHGLDELAQVGGEGDQLAQGQLAAG